MSLLRRNGRASAVATVTAPVRVAAYGRVSTDAQAEKEFNSVEVQRLACERYVELHRDEGWTLLPERFEDPGFSGANTKRPGLERLLAAIEAGQVDAVIVQRLDRLSRSMLDFLNMLEFFKRHGVSFISVSQRFDTSTPVGEMTLNILLSFAQFERQIIAERTRDKLHAARRRGKWTGGTPILGYDTAPEGGKLVVNKSEAEEVPGIFEMYVANPSFVAVAQELNRRGWRRKSWTTRGGKLREGGTWNRLNLRTLLTNPLYAGMQKLGDETFPGEHTAIVPRALFQRVQRLLAENHRTPTVAANGHGALLLRGILSCGSCGTVMAHQWTRKGARLYRYYVCNHARKAGWESCPTKSVSADQIETFVVNEIKRIAADPALQRATFEEALAQVGAQRRRLKAEGKRLEREVAAARAEVHGLAAAIAKVGGKAEQALIASLEAAQERITSLDARLAEIRAQEAALGVQEVNPDDVAKALQDFDELWSVLLTPERERVIRLLIERVTYDGASQKLEITFSPAGIATLAAEVGGEKTS